MIASELRRAAWRMGLQTALLLLACVVLVGITVFVVADQAAANEGRQAVRSASAHVDKPQEAPKGVEIVIDRGGQRLTSPELPEGFPIESDLAATRSDGIVREHLVHRGDDRYLVRTERVGERVNQAIYDQEEYEAERHRLQVALFTAGGLGVLLSAAAGVVLAFRSMRPLAESLAMQDRSVALYETLANEAAADERTLFDNFLDYARKHRDVVARFGRFPHRNAILGRPSSEEELEFLKQPGSRF